MLYAENIVTLEYLNASVSSKRNQLPRLQVPLMSLEIGKNNNLMLKLDLWLYLFKMQRLNLKSPRDVYRMQGLALGIS